MYKVFMNFYSFLCISPKNRAQQPRAPGPQAKEKAVK
jgi:hypothetical protein